MQDIYNLYSSDDPRSSYTTYYQKDNHLNSPNQDEKLSDHHRLQQHQHLTVPETRTFNQNRRIGGGGGARNKRSSSSRDNNSSSSSNSSSFYDKDSFWYRPNQLVQKLDEDQYKLAAEDTDNFAEGHGKQK